MGFLFMEMRKKGVYSCNFAIFIRKPYHLFIIPFMEGQINHALTFTLIFLNLNEINSIFFSHDPNMLTFTTLLEKPHMICMPKIKRPL